MDKLMLEMPSPNVTKMIPLSFSDITRIEPNYFTVTPHPNGIYEYTYLGNRGQVISDCAQYAFEHTYKDHIYDVDVSGFKKPGDVTPAAVGSQRFCTMNYGFAEFLTKIIKHRSAVDVIQDENGNWMEMLNVSQYFRFMRYKAGGEHFPHYDSDFEYKYNGAVTKYSLVAYFTKCDTGELAFVNDKGTKFEGIINDWDRQAEDKEIYLKIKPAPLKIVVFPHTLCHTVLPYTDNGERIICRGDLLYKKV